MRIRCNSLCFSFNGLTVFENLNIEFPEKQVTAVLGPSGCGKTTLLNLISGVLQPDSGSVQIEENGRIGYLFQEPRLLPWKTVRSNVEIVLEGIYNRTEREAAAEQFLGAVGLEGFLDYYPYALSGGMRQRAAIARAFAFPAALMLLDEPFQALDLKLKLGLSTLFVDLWDRDPRTTVFVTHDIQEALILGDRIVVLSERPAQLAGEFENPLPIKERELSNQRLLDLERRLYALLAG